MLHWTFDFSYKKLNLQIMMLQHANEMNNRQNYSSGFADSTASGLEPLILISYSGKVASNRFKA